MFALPGPPPKRLHVRGADYHMEKVFKHDFFAATCLYAAEDPAEFPRIVVKFGRTQMFCGLPLRWYGRWLRQHEHSTYTRLSGLPGIPAWVGAVSDTAYAIEYVDAVPLDHVPKGELPPGFFDRLKELFDAVHARGVAYMDANKRSNILIDAAGRPHLVDFQVSWRYRRDLPWPLSAVCRHVTDHGIRQDTYHLYKHKRRLACRELTEKEARLGTHRSRLHALHTALTTPWRALRRKFLREQYRRGRLVSPTAELEDHEQPEKQTWRTSKGR
jgi:hypothetical protein